MFEVGGCQAVSESPDPQPEAHSRTWTEPQCKSHIVSGSVRSNWMGVGFQMEIKSCITTERFIMLNPS